MPRWGDPDSYKQAAQAPYRVKQEATQGIGSALRTRYDRASASGAEVLRRLQAPRFLTRRLRTNNLKDIPWFRIQFLT